METAIVISVWETWWNRVLVDQEEFDDALEEIHEMIASLHDRLVTVEVMVAAAFAAGKEDLNHNLDKVR